MIIDGTNAVLGRLATSIAKDLLRGNEIIVINADKIVISGNPEATYKEYKTKVARGDPHKGPFYPKYPERVFRRIVRGMLPFKTSRGRTAFRKLKVFSGNPENLKGELNTKTANDLNCKYITVYDLCKRLGAKID